jgi:hypothetical protein
MQQVSLFSFGGGGERGGGGDEEGCGSERGPFLSKESIRAWLRARSRVSVGLTSSTAACSCALGGEALAGDMAGYLGGWTGWIGGGR